ncbi:MAG: helix-turn-helix transcriptional regulator [Kiritimatiellae bacterium]|nr:helix-turn-helix transcriptional regulator [Kiritimatiellia bacterium]
MNKTSLKMPIRQTTELRGLGAAARRCGVSHTHLRKVLQGERKPSAELARKMRRMGLKPGELKPEER